MAYITTATLALGVLLCVVAGLLCHIESGSIDQHLSWLPHVGLLLSHPQAALGAGAVLIVLSLVCQPTRVE